MKTPNVKVSVIMPAYNTASSIDLAIRSVLAQKKVAFELLIGDDASTDQTWKKIQSYRSDPRIRAFRFRRNQGPSVTRNQLIAKARGKYLSSCDADDVMLPGNLSVLSRILDRYSSVGVTYGDLYLKPLRGRLKIKRRFVPKKSWDLLGGCFANGGTLIRRALMRKVGGYRAKFKFLEDCDLFLRLSERTRFYYRSGKPLYLQKQSRGSLSDQSLKKQKEISQILVRETIQRRYGRKIKW